MSTTAAVNFRTEFEPLAKHAFQAGAKLNGTTRERMNANARTVSFPKLGKGIATERNPGTTLTPMNTVHTNVTVTIRDWDATDYAYIEDLEKLAFDEKLELAQVAGYAAGRRYDQIIIDAMNASAFATSVPISEGGANTSLNIEKLTRAAALMNANGVPAEGRNIAVTADALMFALRETEISSADYNTFKALTTGEISSFMNFKFHIIETRAEGGLPLAAANQRKCLAWHRDAVGVASNGGMKAAVDWIPTMASWQIRSYFSAGAVTIDTDGVINVLCYEA